MPVKRVLLLGCSTLALVIAASASMRAHKPITSKYTYTTDLFPIFRERCGDCHNPDGVGPMSLLTYQDARPWAQSIKDEVISLRMPPRYAEAGFGPVLNGHGLSAREIDMIVEWANGGTPQGPRQSSPEPPPAPTSTPPTEADLRFELPEFTLAKDVNEETRTFVIHTGLTSPRFLRALDVTPGEPAMVRSVVVLEKDSVLAAWQPGQNVPVLDAKAAYRLSPRAELVARIHYKKTWRHEGQALADRTTIRLWLAKKAPPAIIERKLIAGSSAGDALEERTSAADADTRFAEPVKQDLQLVALVPEIPASLESLRIEAVRADGSRQPMLLLTNPSPQWPARYWFQTPVTLTRGSRIEVVASPRQALRDRRIGLQIEYVAAKSLDKSR